MKRYKIINLLLAILLLTSCFPHKKILYLQDIGETEMKGDTLVHHQTAYTLKPGDNLYIKIISLDEKTSDFLNIEHGNAQNVYQDAGLYYTSYQIDNEGYLHLPYLGNLFVKNRTIKETEALLQSKINQFLNDASVIVRIVNFNITILGEVNNPGKFNIYQENINVFQALGMVGDISDFGNRAIVTLIRNLNDGSIIEQLDLNDKNIINSPYYWLMPDDIIYVERLKGKSFAFVQFPYALLFSTITMTLLILSYFN
ncbi:polysaccharide biosynthesis/export family protein [Bacteroidota bacterium]